MTGTAYTPSEKSDAIKLYTAVHSIPPDKQTILTVLANTFVNGMKAQEHLTASSVPAAR